MQMHMELIIAGLNFLMNSLQKRTRLHTSPFFIRLACLPRLYGCLDGSDTNHEEFIQIGCKNTHKIELFEERQRAFESFLQNTGIVIQPRKLTV
ncbi:MAG: hypothetical protein BWX44_00819 [Spirochaetes bacterium ADurb.Bin001]|nr:MAG: hypothetical protein BWX44_00819 [Spirochaetes bacterium ADurb.Bin001]